MIAYILNTNETGIKLAPSLAWESKRNMQGNWLILSQTNWYNYVHDLDVRAWCWSATLGVCASGLQALGDGSCCAVWASCCTLTSTPLHFHASNLSWPSGCNKLTRSLSRRRGGVSGFRLFKREKRVFWLGFGFAASRRQRSKRRVFWPSVAVLELHW